MGGDDRVDLTVRVRALRVLIFPLLTALFRTSFDLHELASLLPRGSIEWRKQRTAQDAEILRGAGQIVKCASPRPWSGVL